MLPEILFHLPFVAKTQATLRCLGIAKWPSLNAVISLETGLASETSELESVPTFSDHMENNEHPNNFTVLQS
jgi:hypothetical protein